MGDKKNSPLRNQRRKNVVERLSQQLKDNVKLVKQAGTDSLILEEPLSENDKKRILTELSTLESRITY